jgi:hypothetical protein
MTESNGITSGTSAAIYITNCGDATITLAAGSENALSNGGSFVNIDDKNIDGVIYSTEDLALQGEGSLTVVSPAGHGIVSKDDLTVESGTYTITAASHGVSGKDELVLNGGTFTIQAAGDGVHADNDEDDTLGNICITGGTWVIEAGDDAIQGNASVQIDGGSFQLSAVEAIESTQVLINDGTIDIQATDDGINATNKVSVGTPTIQIAGGSITITMAQGDTDALDANGSIYINGGQPTGDSVPQYPTQAFALYKVVDGEVTTEETTTT